MNSGTGLGPAVRKIPLNGYSQYASQPDEKIISKTTYHWGRTLPPTCDPNLINTSAFPDPISLWLDI